MILLFLAACAYPEGEFEADLDAVMCEWRSDCYGDSYGQCLADAQASWDGQSASCSYDQRAARDCVRGMRRMDCPFDGVDPAFPPACDQVWTCL